MGPKNKKFIDRMDRAHNLDLRKIEMMKLGKKSEAFGARETDESLKKGYRNVYIK